MNLLIFDGTIHHLQSRQIIPRLPDSFKTAKQLPLGLISKFVRGKGGKMFKRIFRDLEISEGLISIDH